MQDIQEIIKQINSHLKEYLVSKGIVIQENGFFRCISPTHEDKHPSSCLSSSDPEKDGAVFHCFSCGQAGNLFTAAHLLEDLPATGPEFFQETMKVLADRYNIPYEPSELDEDVKREIQKRRAYADATRIISENIFKMENGQKVLRTDHPAPIHLTERGITSEGISLFKIGCIDSLEGFLTKMESLGWDRDYLLSEGLGSSNLFNPTGIIIPIYDDKGRPVGFVTRKTDMKVDEHGSEKYVNSLNSSIYKKGEILFGLNNYKKDGNPLIICEGYLDCAFLTQQEIPNVCAIGATVLTEQHISMLVAKGIKKLILVLDSDEGGTRGINLAIERIAPYKFFNVRIVELPKDTDPDSWVKEHGAEEFKKLIRSEEAISPFVWTIKRVSFEDDPLQVVEKSIPIICTEESSIARLKMIKELAKVTSVSEIEIKKDVDRSIQKESSVYLEEIARIANIASVDLSRKKSKETKGILESALIQIKNLDKLYQNAANNHAEFDQRRSNLRDKIERGDFKYGLKMPHFKRLETKLDGFPTEEPCLTFIGGRPAAGKTILLTSMGIDIIESNSNAIIFFMSIDDSTELMTLKILAAKTGLRTSELKRYCELTTEDKKKVDAGWEWFDGISKRFIIIDAVGGKSPEALESHADWLVKTYPDRKKVFFLDNFHKLQGFKKNKKTDEISETSEFLKDITQTKFLHLATTVELRKLENSVSRPTSNDLKDSVQMEYDSDLLMLIHCDKVVNPDTMVVWENYTTSPTERMAYVEVNVAKNKINGGCDRFAYRLNNNNLQMTEVPWSEVQAKIQVKGQHTLKADNSVKAY